MTAFTKPVTLTATAAAAPFTISNGQVLTPYGTPFAARGVNVGDYDMNNSYANLSAVLSVYPQCNFIRIPCGDYQSPSYFDTFVTNCTNAGIVVGIEDHQDFWPTGVSAGGYGGGQGVVLTGSLLTTQSNWYAALATHFKSNPYVWFMTCNEPTIATTATFNAANNTGTSPNGWTVTANSVAALSTWHKATFDAIRGTGNTNPIMVDVNNPNTWGTNGGMTASVYLGYHNLIWDMHCYGWLWDDSGTIVTLGGNGVGYSTNLTTIETEMKTGVQLLQQLGCADGTMPVIIGEYGNSTNGSTLDANGTQNCQAVQASAGVYTNGSAAWYFGSGQEDNLTDGAAPPTLTTYGKQIATYVNVAKQLMIGRASGASTAVAKSN